MLFLHLLGGNKGHGGVVVREVVRHGLDLVLNRCGISTFLFGVITGGFFGDFIPQLAKMINPESTLELPSLFTPLNDTVMILIGAMCLGFVQIISGMAISFVEKLKRRQFLDALFEEVTWWIVFAGAALRGSVLNVYINTNLMKDKKRAEAMEKEAGALLTEYFEKAERTYEYVRGRIHG